MKFNCIAKIFMTSLTNFALDECEPLNLNLFIVIEEIFNCLL